MMNARMIAVCALAMTTLSVPAMAEEMWCKPGAGQQKSEAELAAMLKAKGYDVRKTGTEHGCFEAKAIGPDGKRVEVYVDPITGTIVQEKK